MDDIKDNHFTQSELEELTDLYNAMLTMEDSSEMHKFFVDLCSINELHSLIIRELSPKEAPESDTVKTEKKTTGRARGKARSSTKVSSTTISRVKKCLVNPEGGYRTALNRLEETSGENKEDKQ